MNERPRADEREASAATADARVSPSADGTLARRLGVLVVAALVARLVGLGARVAHFDEARVAYWTLQYARTGEWTYFPYVHGPFLFHVDAVVFETLGASDLTMRLPVAVLGGLLPAAAWLYRDHLAPDETLALGVVLAANPLLLYYSRFLRNDLLLVAFALTALGFGLRALSTGRARYVVAAAVALAFAVTTKENALLYGCCWVGAAVALAVARWRDGDAEAVSPLLRRRARELAPSAALSVVAFLAIVVTMYAPRGGDGPRFEDLASLNPAVTLAAVRAATVVPVRELASVWVADNATGPLLYVGHFGLLVALLVVGAPAVLVLAVVGVRRDRDGGDMRPLVAFAAVWAGLSLVGYPLAADLVAGWTALHVVAPLSLPAAVGLAALVRRARGGSEGDAGPSESDGPRPATSPEATRARRLFVVLAVAVGVVAVVGVYLVPASPLNPLGQPVQPSNDLRPTVDAAVDAAATNEGVDVAYYGEFYRDNWIYRLPLQWYFARADVQVTSVTSPAELGDDPPPVVIALDSDADEVEPRLDGYDCRVHELAPWANHGADDRRTETRFYLRSPVGAPGTSCAAADDTLYDRLVRAIPDA